MQSFLSIFMMIANVVAGAIVYFSINKNWESKKKIVVLGIVFGGMYVIVSILFALSSIGLHASELPSNAKMMLISAYVPVNIIAFIPFIIRSYNKVTEKELGEKKFENRLKLAGVIFIIVIIMEFFSIRGTVKNIFIQYNALVEKEKSEAIQYEEEEMNNRLIKGNRIVENTSVTEESTNSYVTSDVIN